jgi:hypothetical protein
VADILKMATGRNFSISGHHYLPTYQILMISDNVEFLPTYQILMISDDVEFLRYCGGHFENGDR